MFRMTLHTVTKQRAVCNQHDWLYRLRNQTKTAKDTYRTTRKVSNSEVTQNRKRPGIKNYKYDNKFIRIVLMNASAPSN